MNRKCVNFAVLGAVAVLLPTLMVAQMDQNGNGGGGSYPQPSTGTSQQNGQGGMQGGTPSQTNQTGSMRDSLGAPGENGQQMMDKQFVRMAVEGGLGDIQLDKLATVKGGDGVKELAQKLVDDHVTMNKDLETVADSMGVMVPKKESKDAQMEYGKLDALSGKDFDTEFLTFTAKAHFQELHIFHMEASASASPDLTEEVVKEMGMMPRHLGLVVDTAKEEGIALPPRPQRPGTVTASK
jgi:putative membrane protein